MEPKIKISPLTNTTSSSSFRYVTTGTSTAPDVSVSARSFSTRTLKQLEAEKKRIENAVYGHIRALRSLGRTTTDLLEVASALNLSIEEVRDAVERLQTRGIRFS